MVTRTLEAVDVLTGNWVNIRVLDHNGHPREFFRRGNSTTVDAFRGETLYIEVTFANGIVEPNRARVNVVDIIDGAGPQFDLAETGRLLVPIGITCDDQFVLINASFIQPIEHAKVQELWNGYTGTMRTQVSGNVRYAMDNYRRLQSAPVEQMTVYFHVMQPPMPKVQVKK